MKQNDKNSFAPSRVTFENSNRVNQISAAPVRIKAPAKKPAINNDLVYDSSRARAAAASDAAYFSNEAAKKAYTPAQAAYCQARAAGQDINAALDAAAPVVAWNQYENNKRPDRERRIAFYIPSKYTDILMSCARICCLATRHGGCTTYNGVGYWQPLGGALVMDEITILESFFTGDIAPRGLLIVFDDIIQALHTAGESTVAVVIDGNMYLC